MAKKRKAKKSPKSKAKKTTKRSSKKKSSKRKAGPSAVRKMVIVQERVPLGRAAAENAAGGFGAGFGIAAGHEFGEWMFD